MAHLRPEQSTFEWFPRYIDNPSDHLKNILVDVSNIIAKDSLPLWWTEVGHVSAEEGLLNIGEKSVALRDALRETKVPVVFAPDRLHRNVKHIFNGQVLDPQRFSIFLRNKNDQIRNWSLPTKRAVLEYLLSEPGFTDIGSLELIPFKDGRYRSIADYPAFVCRNDREIDLFTLQNDHNIDFDKLSISTSSVLQNWCSSSAGHKCIRYRSASDFRDYCLKFVFVRAPQEQDMVSLESEASAFISKAWIWIVEQSIDILGVISDLWLVPLSNGRHRKVKPRNSTSEIISAPIGPVGDFMRTFDAKYSSIVKPLLKTTGLSIRAQGSLISTSRSQASLHIKQGDNMVDFSQWLYHIRSLVNSAPEDEKATLLKILASNIRPSPSQSGYESIRAGIGALQIFKKVSWKVEGDKA
jgi:sacsin